MGADLYITSIHDKVEKRYKPKFQAYAAKRDAATNTPGRKHYQRKVEEYYGKLYGEGYFRDSYNVSNLLWRLGLDYWGWFQSYLDDKAYLSPDKAEDVLREVESRKHMLDWIENPQEAEYFREKYEDFCAFLRTAIELDESVYCSI